MRYFNTEGCCKPDEHYMVNLYERLNKIKQSYVDRGKYFVINKGRQYGKTTTLTALEQYLKTDYLIISLDFQLMGTEDFSDETIFSRSMAENIIFALKSMEVQNQEIMINPFCKLVLSQWDFGLRELFIAFSSMCKNCPKPIVLMIDEVDSASNNQVFIDFLSQLRGYYLKREKMPIFHSVILAGVYNIKNLKLKLRPDKEHQYNSPWNIAAKFKINMSFSANEIAAMLKEYEKDYDTGMDIPMITREIYDYTSGYPVLVSAICKYLDEDLPEEEKLNAPREAWSKEGITKAVKKILMDDAPLFESMIRQMKEYPDLKRMMQAILFQGKRITFNTDNPIIELASMFGYIVSHDGTIQVANRIFEMRLYSYFLSEEELTNAIYDEAQGNKNDYFQDNRLNMELVLKKFVEHFTDIYGENDEKFLETHGRKLFLLYLKPIINGKGNYYIEAQTRDARRTDVIVDYLGEQFIIELKIWRGNEYNERGEKQLSDYLEYYHKDKGYMLSFNFHKKKTIGMKEIKVGGKTIVEAVV